MHGEAYIFSSLCNGYIRFLESVIPISNLFEDVISDRSIANMKKAERGTARIYINQNAGYKIPSIHNRG